MSINTNIKTEILRGEIMIWWIASWFIVGFICATIMWIDDMRGKPFDENYFGSETIVCSIAAIIFGYISPIILFSIIASEKKYFTRFVYWVANIGVKNNDKT